MESLLETLEGILKNFGSAALQYLNPPLSSDTALHSFVSSRFGVKEVPGDLLKLYKWHNGTKVLAADEDVRPLWLADELALCSFDTIDAELNADEIYSFASEQLMPVFTSFFGEVLAIDLKSQHGQLIYCSTSDYEIPSKISKFDSIPALLETIIEHYKSGCYLYDEEEYLELDFDKYDEYMEIGERLNPHSDYWRVKREFAEGD